DRHGCTTFRNNHRPARATVKRRSSPRADRSPRCSVAVAEITTRRASCAPLRGFGNRLRLVLPHPAGDRDDPFHDAVSSPARTACGDRWKGGTNHMSELITFISSYISTDEEGQGLAEYALILALIAIVAIVALIFLGTQVSGILGKVGSSVYGRRAVPRRRHRLPDRGRRTSGER